MQNMLTTSTLVYTRTAAGNERKTWIAAHAPASAKFSGRASGRSELASWQAGYHRRPPQTSLSILAGRMSASAGGCMRDTAEVALGRMLVAGQAGIN